MLAGMLVFAYGYITHYTPYVDYDNGYTYIDYVSIFGYALAFVGFLILFYFVFHPPFRKWAREHGASARFHPKRNFKRVSNDTENVR